MRAWLVVVAGCASTAAPPPVAAPAPHVVAATSCADAGVILRGPVQLESASAGSDREAAIAAACTRDRWSTAALECIGASRTPIACLDKHLPPDVVTRYQIALAEWAATYEAASDLDDVPKRLSCDVAIDAVERVSDDATIERDWVLSARKRVVAARCASGWSQAALQCFASAPSDALTSCVAREADNDELAAELAAIAARAKAIAAAKQKPATVTCAKVAAAYYADAKWHGAADKATVAKSRRAMQRECTQDSWDDTARACLATGGDATCFADIGIASLWGYPAFEVAPSKLPPECDDYRLVVARVARCTNVPAATREAIVQMVGVLEERAQRDDVRGECATIAGSLRALPAC